MPTDQLVATARLRAQAGENLDEILAELRSRFSYRDCPATDKGLIAEFDRTVIVPLFGYTRLSPQTIRLPGTRESPVPTFYRPPQQPGISIGSPKIVEASKANVVEKEPRQAARTPTRAFVSYSHHDEDMLHQFQIHLSALKHLELLEVWSDRETLGGGVVDPRIREQLERAQLFLLLISKDFLASEYCCKIELKRALERQQEGVATIIPIIVRECDWDIPELRQFKALPKDGKPVDSRHWRNSDEAFTNVATGIRLLLGQKHAS
jgi:hypothetical protein